MLLTLFACLDPTEKPCSDADIASGGCASDSDSGATIEPYADCTGETTFDDPGDPDWLFSTDPPALRLELPPESVAYLESVEDGGAEDSKHTCGTLYVDRGDGEQAVAAVGVRLVGKKFNSFQAYDSKPYLDVSFEAFVEGRTISGLPAFRLYNQWEDASGFQLYLGYQLWRDAGYPAPRAGFATLTLGDRALGLYQTSEAVSAAFVEHWVAEGALGTAGGGIFEGEYGNDLTSGNPPDLKFPGVQGEDSSWFDRLADVVGTSADFETDLRPYMDPERWHQHWALEMAVGAVEGYSEIENNWYLYQDPGADLEDLSDDRFTMIPWGFDQVLQNLSVLPDAPQGELPKHGNAQTPFLLGQCAALRAAVGEDGKPGTVDWEGLREEVADLDLAFPPDPIEEVDRWEAVEIRAMRTKVDHYLEQRPLDLRAWIASNCP